MKLYPGLRRPRRIFWCLPHNSILVPDTRRYAFVAVARAIRWVHMRLMKDKSAASPKRFLKSLDQAAPFHIRTILTDNGKESTDRLFASRQRAATGEHEFDQLCTALGIEHRLTPVRRP